MCRLCASVAVTMPISRMSTSGWIRVPKNSLPRVKRRTKRASRSVRGRPGAVRGSTNVGSRSSSLARSTRCRTLRGGDPAADVFPFRACGSWLRFFRGGDQTTRTRSNCFLWIGQPDSRGRTLCATRLMNRRSIFNVDGTTRLTGPNPVSHPSPEPPFDLQRKGSGGGGRTRGTGERVHVELSGGDAGGTANREGRPRPLLRKSPETADVREGPQDDGRTDDRTGAPQWRVRQRRSRLAH